MIDKVYDGCRIFLDNHEYILNNVYIFEWESDLFAISTSKYAVEIEVKISRSDFLADFKKKKHKLFNEARQAGKGHEFTRIPNRFYFACPEGMIKSWEVPAYAGLIYTNPKYADFHIEKKAPLIHKVKNDFTKPLLSKYYNGSINTRQRVREILYQIDSGIICMPDVEKKLKSLLRLLK